MNNAVRFHSILFPSARGEVLTSRIYAYQHQPSVLNNHPVFHNERDVFECLNIFNGVVIHGNDICHFTGFNGANLIR